MKKSAKIWLMTAGLLMTLGTAMVVSTACSVNGDFTQLGIVKYERNTYEMREEFHNISLNSDTADIRFILSENDTCKVVCDEQEKVKYSVSVEEGTLNIKMMDKREWFDYIGIFFGEHVVNVYLPKTEYGALVIEESTGNIEIPGDFQFESMDISVSTGDVKSSASASGNVKIKASTGDIHVENITAKTMALSVSTGNVTASKVVCEDMTIGVSTGDTYLNDISCQSFTSTGSTGDITLKNVIILGKCAIERSTGDVKFEGFDAGEITVITDTGDVTGTFLTGKNFETETDTGSVKVPQDNEGGKCEITTDTGDIKITIKTE